MSAGLFFSQEPVAVVTRATNKEGLRAKVLKRRELVSLLESLRRKGASFSYTDKSLLLWGSRPTFEEIASLELHFDDVLLLLGGKPEPRQASAETEEDSPYCYSSRLASLGLESAPSVDGLEIFEEPLPITDQTPLVFLDTETTGLSKDDRIIQIYIRRVTHEGEISEFYSLFNPEGRRSTLEAYKKHKISDYKLMYQPRFSSKVEKIKELLSGGILVAHNAGFDQRMLFQEFVRCRAGSLPIVAALCTKKLAKAFFPKEESVALEALAESLGLDAGKAHDAKGDVQTLCSFWFRLVSLRPYWSLAQWVQQGGV